MAGEPSGIGSVKSFLAFSFEGAPEKGLGQIEAVGGQGESGHGSGVVLGELLDHDLDCVLDPLVVVPVGA